MSIFDNNPYIKLGEPAKVAPRRAAPGELAGGSFWSLLREPDGYVLDYASGELSGSHRRLKITVAEGEQLQLKPEDALATSILIAHGEG